MGERGGERAVGDEGFAEERVVVVGHDFAVGGDILGDIAVGVVGIGAVGTTTVEVAVAVMGTLV